MDERIMFYLTQYESMDRDTFIDTSRSDVINAIGYFSQNPQLLNEVLGAINAAVGKIYELHPDWKEYLDSFETKE